jgi:protein SCO1/2
MVTADFHKPSGRSSIARGLVALALLAIGSSALAGPTRTQSGGEEDKTHPNVRFDQKLGAKVPLDLTFLDENGNEVTLGQCIDGKPSILILAYYRCPQLCGQVFVGVLEVIRKMRLTCGKDFNIVTVSFDPKEKPGLALAKKRHFVTEYGRKEADAGWKFLTGKQENIDVLTETVGFHYEFDKTIKEYNHPSGIMIVTPEGVVSRYLPGIEYIDRGFDGKILDDSTKTVRLSLVEAGNGEIGSASDKFFLTCYRYNPHTGKYTFSVMWIVRAGGLLTLLIIAGVFAWKNWKLPGARLLVIGIVSYVVLLPLIMYTSFSIDVLPNWAWRAMLLPIGLVLFFVGRWIWRTAARRERTLDTAATQKTVQSGVL